MRAARQPTRRSHPNAGAHAASPAPLLLTRFVRSAPDTDPSYGHLDVDTGELDPFFVFRAGADGALTTPRDELVRMTALCKHNLDELNALRNRQRDVIRMGLRDAVAPLLSSVCGGKKAGPRCLSFPHIS